MPIDVTGTMQDRYDEVLTPAALSTIQTLHEEFGTRRRALLDLRRQRASRWASGARPDFLDETREVREDRSWRVAAPAPGLEDRRVEITGPVERKMAINALNSGAKVWLADFEDAIVPTFDNVVSGQLNLMDAIRGTIELTTPEGRRYAVTATTPPTIVVRPRGLHLDDTRFIVDGEAVAGCLVDFALYLLHNGAAQIERGSGPYFYLPKLEGHLEARWWNEVFVRGADLVGIPHESIRATVLVETLPAAFEMEEILYELREHSAGLNAGRWDYLFSVIKCLGRDSAEYVLPDRNVVTMTVPFLRAYTDLLVRTCHRRGAHAIGGMAAFIPSRRDPEVNERAIARVREDKAREARDGFDGSWVAHPDLVPVCAEVFDGVLGSSPDQRHVTRDDVRVTAAELLDIASTPGSATEDGLRNNLRVAVRYVESWLRGTGAVAISNLMEDAATAEIARTQVWQWLRHGVVLDTGRIVTAGLVRAVLAEEGRAAAADARSADVLDARVDDAVRLVDELVTGGELADFLTVRAYALL